MGQVDIKDRVTIAQFNKLRQSMEEKQDRLTQDLQNLMTEIRRHRPPHDGASNHSGDREDSEVGGTRGLHMVEEEDIVKEMMMNLKMRLMTTASNSVLVADVIEEATMKKVLAN